MRRRRTEFCKHFRAPFHHKTCEKGIDYDSFPIIQGKGRLMPCVQNDRNEGCAPCELAEYPTPEEIAERDKRDREYMQRVGKIREAIVTATEGKRGVRGRIPCPCCDGQVGFSVSGYNGHIHARCSTPGCASWME